MSEDADRPGSPAPQPPANMADRVPSSNKRRKKELRERKARRAAREVPGDESARKAEQAAEHLREARRGTRNPLDTIRRMAAGERFHPPRLSYLNLVQEILQGARERGVETYALALVHALLGTALLADNPGPDRESIRNAFVNLAARHADWMRRPHAWRAGRRNRRAQLSSLIRHLVASYDVPLFFDQAWTLPTRWAYQTEPRLFQDWFLHVASGANLRTARGLPFPLSKRMAHHTLEADASLAIGQAIRFGQARAVGLEPSLARAFATTRAGDVTDAPGGRAADPFWASVLRFFAPYGMVDPACVGPVVDYLIHQRFEPSRRPDGTLAPPHPGLTMKGRTLDTLLRQVDDWHRQAARVRQVRGRAWPALGIKVVVDDAGERRGRFIWRLGSKRKTTTWIVEELLTGKELAEEGRALSHCVYSYAWSCEKGQSSIWSLRRKRTDAGGAEEREERRVTVEIRPMARQIVQARGSRNRPPTESEWRILDAFAREASLKIPAWLRHPEGA